MVICHSYVSLPGGKFQMLLPCFPSIWNDNFMMIPLGRFFWGWFTTKPTSAELVLANWWSNRVGFGELWLVHIDISSLLRLAMFLWMAHICRISEIAMWWGKSSEKPWQKNIGFPRGNIRDKIELHMPEKVCAGSWPGFRWKTHGRTPWVFESLMGYYYDQPICGQMAVQYQYDFILG